MVEHLANKYKNRNKSIVICGDNTGSDRLQIYVLRLGCSVKADVSSGYITYLAYRNSSIMQMKNKKLICFVQPHPLARLLCDWFVVIDMNEVYLACFSPFSSHASFLMLFSCLSSCTHPPSPLPSLVAGGNLPFIHVQVEVCCYGC